MANVVHKVTMRLVTSANTPEYPPQIWLIEPNNLSTLINGNVPSKYWKLNAGGDDLEEMNAAEKATVDADELTQARVQNRQVAIEEPVKETGEGVSLRALVELFNKRDNYIINRLVEVQNRVQAMLDSSGNLNAMKSDGLAVSISPTSTRTKQEAIDSYVADINAGNQDT